MGQHTPIDQQRRLVSTWRRSNLSKAAFARAHRIRNATFLTWVTRHPPDTEEPPATPHFIQVSVAPPPSGAFPLSIGPHELRFDAPPPVAWLAALVRELASC